MRTLKRKIWWRRHDQCGAAKWSTGTFWRRNSSSNGGDEDVAIALYKWRTSSHKNKDNESKKQRNNNNDDKDNDDDNQDKDKNKTNRSSTNKRKSKNKTNKQKNKKDSSSTGSSRSFHKRRNRTKNRSNDRCQEKPAGSKNINQSQPVDQTTNQESSSTPNDKEQKHWWHQRVHALPSPQIRTTSTWVEHSWPYDWLLRCARVEVASGLIEDADVHRCIHFNGRLATGKEAARWYWIRWCHAM